jgi:hypothetical protein
MGMSTRDKSWNDYGHSQINRQLYIPNLGSLVYNNTILTRGYNSSSSFFAQLHSSSDASSSDAASN